jgi:tRNA A22 N-methylase
MVRERGYDYVVLAARADSDRDAWSGPLPLNDLLEAGPRLIHSSDPVVRDHWEREAQRLEGVIATDAPPREQTEARSRLHLARRILAQLPACRRRCD